MFPKILTTSLLSRLSNLFGTIFHIRLPLKERACVVMYLKVLLSSKFGNYLLRRSYRVFFKSMMIGGRKLFIDLYISINNVCMLFSGRFHELSFHSKSSKFASSISYKRRRLHLYFILFYLFYLLIYLFILFKFYSLIKSPPKRKRFFISRCNYGVLFFERTP